MIVWPLFIPTKGCRGRTASYQLNRSQIQDCYYPGGLFSWICKNLLEEKKSKTTTQRREWLIACIKPCAPSERMVNYIATHSIDNSSTDIYFWKWKVDDVNIFKQLYKFHLRSKNEEDSWEQMDVAEMTGATWLDRRWHQKAAGIPSEGCSICQRFLYHS